MFEVREVLSLWLSGRGYRTIEPWFGLIESQTEGSWRPRSLMVWTGLVVVDFGDLGFMVDAVLGRRRKVWALVFTAVYSRHCCVRVSRIARR